MLASLRIHTKEKMTQRVKDLLFWLVVLAVLGYTAYNMLSTFVLMKFKVPTPSMEPTVMAGSHVLVNKMAYGRRTFHVPSYDSVRHGTITRGWAMGEPRRGDIMVFNQTCHLGWDTIAFDIYKYFVKRCVALPGDTFYIDSCRYRVKGHCGDLGLIEAQNMQELVSRDTAYVRRIGMPYVTLPFWDSLGWNVRNFGPLYIPKKGDTIRFDDKNVRIYRKYIEWELGHKIIWDERGFLDIDGTPMDHHVMRQNYYFMCGDNAPNSLDSRFWGLVPEEFIVGKVILVY